MVSGITIGLFSLMEITVLGEDTVHRTIYPLYLLIKQISIADFIENLDAIVALNMIITAYVKLSVDLFAAIRSIQLLTNMIDNRPLIFPVTLICYILGLTMSTNINEHIYVGVNIFPRVLWVPLLILLPGVLLIVTLIRRKWLKKQKKQLQKI